MAVPEDVPSFLYPKWWGNSDPDDDGGSYSYQNDKLPVVKDEEEQAVKSYQNGELTANIDKTIGRIPIREVFINVDMIVKAFEESSDVKKVIEVNFLGIVGCVKAVQEYFQAKNQILIQD